MKKFGILFVFLVSLFFVTDVSALENKFLGTYISSSGKFLSLNSYPSWTDQGYVITNGTGDTLAESSFAQPSSDFVLGPNGGAITQCEMSFLEGNYYSVTYYFGFENLNAYPHPYYTAWSNKFDVCTSSTCSPSHGFDSISSGIEYSYVGGVFQYIGTFTVIFKAPKTGTCVNIAFSSSNNSSNTSELAFLGYKYNDLGSKPLSSSDIQIALSQDFTELENKIDAMTSEQEETNDKLDDLNDSITSDSDDIESGSCGIICKLKGIFTGIVELPGKLVNLLIEALQGLFVPTNEQLQEIIEDSSELAENFGFVGQTIDFFIDIFTSLLGMVNADGCITLPEFTIGETSLFDEHTFWEETQYCLADNEILSENIDTIRTITSIGLVCMFITFAAAQFHNILSKTDNYRASKDSYSIDADNRD